MKKIIGLTLALCVLSVLMALPAAAQNIETPINVYEDKTIVLDNAVYRDEFPAIAVHNSAKLTLVLKGNSVIEHKATGSEGMYSALFLNDNSQLVIVDDPDDPGMGSLELKNWDFGICAGNTGEGCSIQVDGVNLMIDSTLGGICATSGDLDEISIRNADVSVKNTEHVGIGSYFGGIVKNLSIENSNISVDSRLVGIGADQAEVNNISINNSKFNVKSRIVGIGGRDADISRMTIANNIGSVTVAGEPDMPAVGIGMVTGVAERLSGIGFVRVYTMDELALKNNFISVDSPVTGIGAARKVAAGGEKGTSIKKLSIDGGFTFTGTSQENGVCIGAKDLNIENISIQNADVTAMARDTVLGCVETEPGQASRPTAITVGGQTRMIALGSKTFAPERNTLHVADTAALTSDVSPLNESQINEAAKDFQNALNMMDKPGQGFSGTIEELEKLTSGGQHTDLELLLDFIKDTLTTVPDTPDEPDKTPDVSAKPEVKPAPTESPESFDWQSVRAAIAAAKAGAKYEANVESEIAVPHYIWQAFYGRNVTVTLVRGTDRYVFNGLDLERSGFDPDNGHNLTDLTAYIGRTYSTDVPAVENTDTKEPEDSKDTEETKDKAETEDKAEETVKPEAAPEPTEEPKAASQPQEPVEEAESETGTTHTALWVILVLIIAALAIGAIVIVKKKKQQ